MAFWDVDNYHGPAGSTGPGRWVTAAEKPWTAERKCVLVASNGTARCLANGALAAHPVAELELWASRIAMGWYPGKKGRIELDPRCGYRAEIRVVVEGGGRTRPEVLAADATITESGAVLEEGIVPAGLPKNVRVYVRRFPHYLSRSPEFQLPLETIPQDGDVIFFKES